MARPHNARHRHSGISIELTQAESVPFWAGYRCSISPADLSGNVAADLAFISPHLTLPERKYLALGPDTFFILWFAIGCMWSALGDFITSARHL